MRIKLVKIWSSERTLVRLLGLLLAASGLLLVVFFAIYYSNHYLFRGGSTSLEQQLNILKQHVLSEPGDSSTRLQLATMHFELGEYAKAIEQGEAVLVADPNNQDALYLVGLAHLLVGNAQQGISSLTKFIDLRLGSTMWRTDLHLEEALYYVGNTYIETGQLESARQALSRALEINHTDADAIFLLGQTYERSGQVESAADQYLLALSYVPNFEAAYLALSHLPAVPNQPGLQDYAQAGLDYCRRDYPPAVEKLTLVIRKQPQFTPAYVLLGLVYEGQGEPDQAIQALEKALNLDPDNFLAQHAIGRLTASREATSGSKP